jgi:hypothetical protein
MLWKISGRDLQSTLGIWSQKIAGQPFIPDQNRNQNQKSQQSITGFF